MKRRHVSSACGNHKVVLALLLEHAPPHFDFGVASICSESRLPINRQPLDPHQSGQPARDLVRKFRRVLGSHTEQYSITGVHPGFAIATRDPAGIQLGYLRGFWDRRVWFLSGESPAPTHTAHLCWPDKSGSCLSTPKLNRPESASTKGIAVSGVLRTLKAHRHVALGAKVVNLVRLHLLDDPDQIGAIGEVAVMESEPSVTFMRILVEVIDAAGVERRCTPLDPMHLVALFEQQLRQVAAVLPRDACDQGDSGLECCHGGI